ncbi:MAG TPA: hemerythrin domain-containing protein, partial [Kofleriaceae bacterium]|nr:hemerythrin domain-containing protein [Kofleriaceae bacterium]
MLARSHRRLEERLIELRRAVEGIVHERTDSDDLEVVDSVLDFLERSALRHELDEEESLFPRLRTNRDLTALLHDLQIDHEEHRRLVAHLQSLRNGWGPGGPDAGAGAAMAIAVNDLSRAYRAHIEREDRELLPA